MPKVFITNKGGHDYSAANRYGSPVFLTSGKVNQYHTTQLYRELVEGLDGSLPDDHLLISSLNILNSIASAIIARKHGKVNFLLFCDGRYLPRSVDIDSLL